MDEYSFSGPGCLTVRIGIERSLELRSWPDNRDYGRIRTILNHCFYQTPSIPPNAVLMLCDYHIIPGQAAAARLSTILHRPPSGNAAAGRGSARKWPDQTGSNNRPRYAPRALAVSCRSSPGPASCFQAHASALVSSRIRSAQLFLTLRMYSVSEIFPTYLFTSLYFPFA